MLRRLSAALLISTARSMSTTPSRFRSWPITEAAALEPTLKEMGLKVPASDVDGTGRTEASCLSDALVSVGPAGRGGTGSFISADGLIVTNHHVALDAVRRASTSDADYLNDGFVASDRSEEIADADYEVWITKSCVDVSEQLVESRAERDPLKRANLVRDKRQEIAREAEAAAAGAATSVRCEVQEMWPDRTYVLFTYERLRDVRLVYVPPMSLGCFGGDTDNFEWPRHTADFTLLRAYVSPDGAAAEYSASNVPYKPARFLEIATDGASPGEFVFLLGFPGSTMRYAPASRLAYSDDVAVPQLVSDFGEKLALISEYTTDRSAALRMASARKGLANEYKRSMGKRQMMRKLKLIEERTAEEAELIAKAPEAQALLGRLSEVYGTLRRDAPLSDALDNMRGIYHGSTLLAVGHALHEAAIENSKADAQRETAYRARNLPFMVKRLHKRLADLHPPLEAALIRRALASAAKLPIGLLPPDIEALEQTAAALERGAALPPLAALSLDTLGAMLRGEAPAPADDAAVRASAALYPAYCQDRDSTKALLSERDQLIASLLEIQKTHAAEGEAFYPDANGCLRISAGHVEGYTAADAVTHTPLTTLAGLVDKHLEAQLRGGKAEDAVQGAGEFDCPQRLVDTVSADPSVAATPVCILYSTDTVGGNSGSPVLDANGRFVAINFDRQRLGLMNEFKWSREYSRSIGTDVRYLLWLVGSFDNAKWLYDEMVNGRGA
jgi:hypothetical protein